MADEEGSVMVDGEDFESAEDQDQDTSTEQLQDSTDQAEDTQEQDPKAPSQADKSDPQEKPQYTEKGTKLDSNPMSAINQQLANERAKARQYEDFLNDPAKVKAYLEELERERGASQPAPTGEEIRPEQIQTVEDVQKYLGQERAKDRQELEELKRYVGQFSQVQGQLAIGDKIRNDIAQVRQKYPELDPNSPDYDEALEKGLGELYEELDLDQKSGTFRGQVSLGKLAERFMSAAKRGEKQGSRRAQTAVSERRVGRVRTGAKDKGEEVDEAKLSPSQTIASRMQRAYRRVR
jgi:hypothetical protein